MKTIAWILGALLLFGGCSSKRITFNGLICPAGHDEQMLQRDLKDCRYYDQEAIKRASQPRDFNKECLECLMERGYEIE